MNLQSFIVIIAFLVTQTFAALLGIDFGQEFTKAVLVAPGVPFDILLTADTKRKDISGLSILPDFRTNEIYRSYGSQALATCIRRPESCMMYLKPLLGKSDHDPEYNEYFLKFPGVGMGKQVGRNAIALGFGDVGQKSNNTFLVEELVGMNFKEIKQRALEHWKAVSPETVGEIDEVVISVPRYFSEAQRIALSDAAEIAGLQVVALVDDGLAVALDYAQKKEFNEIKKYHLVFDMGAGSIKSTLISIANINDTLTFEIEGYGYDEVLNGHLLTHTVRELILEKFSEKNGILVGKLYMDPRTMRKAWQAAEKTKLVLSANTISKVSIEGLYEDHDFKGEITREEFEESINPLLDSVSNSINESLKDFDVNELESVILSGGSVRVPIIQQKLTEYFEGNESILSKNVNADESVVFGTTIRGAALKHLMRKHRIEVIDPTTMTYAIKYSNDTESDLKDKPFGLIFPRGTLPGQTMKQNLTDFENQFVKELKVDIYEDTFHARTYNFTMPKKFNESLCLGGLEYTGNFGLSKSNIFMLNSMKVTCYPLINGTEIGKPASATMLSKSGYFGFQPLNASMKSKAIRRLENFDSKDEQRRLLSEARNVLEGGLYGLRSFLEDYDENLPHDVVEETNTFIIEQLEWLDYESDEATLEEVSSKVKIYKDIKGKLDLYVMFEDKEKAIGKLYAIINEAKEAINNVEEFKLKAAQEEDKLRAQYEEFGIDYDETNDKLNPGQLPDPEKVSEIFDVIFEFIQLVESMEANKDVYDLINKEDLLEQIKKVKSYIKALPALKTSYKDVHATRTGFLIQQLAAQKKNLKKAERAKAKAEAKKAKKAAEEAQVELDTENEFSETNTETEIETNTVTSIDTDEIKHDEL